MCKVICDDLTIPMYSIGAGAHCDGQVMIVSDVLGLFQAFTPKFVKKYANLAEETIRALLERAGEEKQRSVGVMEYWSTAIDKQMLLVEPYKVYLLQVSNRKIQFGSGNINKTITPLLHYSSKF